jgi:alkanesulfonate monooxygenase SsuD/methylene tetrahydromethanopterin reductase-like flavin-dependent oxidoreductase (luciferase family)
VLQAGGSEAGLDLAARTADVVFSVVVEGAQAGRIDVEAARPVGDHRVVGPAVPQAAHISGGRAAWNAVTTANPATAANFGTTHPDHARRYEPAGSM